MTDSQVLGGWLCGVCGNSVLDRGHVQQSLEDLSELCVHHGFRLAFMDGGDFSVEEAGV